MRLQQQWKTEYTIYKCQTDVHSMSQKLTLWAPAIEVNLPFTLDHWALNWHGGFIRQLVIVDKKDSAIQWWSEAYEPVNNIGPDGPKLICHFANKCLYQKCWDTVFVSVCVCVYVSKVLKEELKFLDFFP